MEPKTHFIVSTAPHIKAEESVSDIMKWVCIALAPAFGVALYNFGPYALILTAICVLACVLTEAVCQKLRGQAVTINDWSAVVTGLLLAAVLPPNVKWWVPVVGGVFAIGVAKHAFGGLGNNIWNPALLARAFLQLALGAQITYPKWANLNPDALTLGERLSFMLNMPFKQLENYVPQSVDPSALPTTLRPVISGATPLQMLSDISAGSVPDATAQPMADLVTKLASDPTYIDPAGQGAQTYMDIVWNGFLGLEGGCIAETSALMLLVGGLFLLFKKIITWEIPVMYLLTVGLLGWVLPEPEGAGVYAPWFTGPALLHLVSGGVMIGAFFMATDMVTSPMTRKGRIIFGLGCGIMTMMIRLYSSAYPEGVCYSILLMNTCVPLIDSWTRPRTFGTKPLIKPAA